MIISRTFILDREDMEKIKALGEKEDRSVNAIIRLIIKQYLKGES